MISLEDKIHKLKMPGKRTGPEYAGWTPASQSLIWFSRLSTNCSNYHLRFPLWFGKWRLWDEDSWANDGVGQPPSWKFRLQEVKHRPLPPVQMEGWDGNGSIRRGRRDRPWAGSVFSYKALSSCKLYSVFWYLTNRIWATSAGSGGQIYLLDSWFWIVWNVCSSKIAIPHSFPMNALIFL